MFAALNVLPQAVKFNSSTCQPLDEEAKFKEEYDYNRIPADIQLAKVHGNAKRVYADGNKESRTCQCCGLPISGEKISLTASLDKLAHLGSGYPLYFKFIKYSIGMLIMMFLVGSIYNLVTNKEAEDCYDNIEAAQGFYCVKGYIHSYIISNKRDDEKSLRIQSILNLVTIVIVMFFFHYLRYQIRKLNVESDEKTVTPSDYTIEIQDVTEETTDDDIKKWIYQLDSKVEIVRVTRTYPIGKYLKLIEKKSNFEMKKAKLDNKSNPKKATEKTRVLAKLNSLDQKIHNCEGTENLKKCPVAYVTFKTAQQAETIRNLKKADNNKLYHIFFAQDEFTTHEFGGAKIKIRRAPEPTDILWENIEYIGQEKLKTRLLTYIGTFMATCFGVILVVNFLQGKAQSHYGKNSGIAQGLSIVVSLVIFFTNFILALIIKYLTSFEKHITYTHYLRGVAQKLAIAQFLNTALTNLFAQLILAKTDSVSSSLENLNFYGKGGLLENMYYVFITNAFLPPLLNIFDSGYFFKLFKRYFLEKKGSSNKMNQMKANSLYEGPNFDLPLKYAGMIKTVLLATFYAPAIPFSLVYTIIGLGLWFWTDKWVLLRRLVLPKSINNDLTDSMVEYLEWAVFTFAAGNIVYAYTLKNSENEFAFDTASRVLVWFALGISLFHIYFPMEALNRKLLPVHQKACETKTFNEARLNFPTDYDIENPLTHTSALKRHIQRLSKSMDPNMKERAMLLQGLKSGFLGITDFLAVPASEGPSEKTSVQHKETRDMEDFIENEEEHQIDWNFLHIYTRKIRENQQDALIKSGIRKVPLVGQLVRGLYEQKPKNQKTGKTEMLTQNVDRDSPEEEDRLATPSNKIYPIGSSSMSH